MFSFTEERGMSYKAGSSCTRPFLAGYTRCKLQGEDEELREEQRQPLCMARVVR